MNDKTIIAIVVAAVLLVGGYLYYSSGPIVTAQGYSSLSAQPDEVSVYLNIETKGATAQEAKDKHSEIADKAITELLKLGFERKEIQTINYQIYPEYDWSSGTQKQKGYIASQQIVVETKEFDKVADIVDASVNAGALVSSINFELSDERQSEYKTQVLQEAGKDAEKKAEATAAGLGKKLGRLVSVSSQDFYYPGPMAYYSKSGESTSISSDNAEAQRAAMNIAPSDIDVTASISVQYKLRSF